jgi:hypothetical protein
MITSNSNTQDNNDVQAIQGDEGARFGAMEAKISCVAPDSTNETMENGASDRRVSSPMTPTLSSCSVGKVILPFFSSSLVFCIRMSVAPLSIQHQTRERPPTRSNDVRSCIMYGCLPKHTLYLASRDNLLVLS